MAQNITIYRGDTLLVNAVYRSAQGVPVDMMGTGSSISAWFKGKDNISRPVQITLKEAVGEYRLTADTASWPLGRGALFIRYTRDGISRTVNPVQIDIQNV